MFAEYVIAVWSVFASENWLRGEFNSCEAHFLPMCVLHHVAQVINFMDGASAAGGFRCAVVDDHLDLSLKSVLIV